ncbi:hypothetical protein [Sterolibacterium denitrificans]|uniref:hypothetical protein n=1 Tax=Sterolibacterium denitrificans TaxID=157592 RepID=UPI0012B6A623|nr:hypothetical protein [Sterolibacterium denitrificans]
MIVLQFESGGIARNRRNTAQRSGQGLKTAARTQAANRRAGRAALDGEIDVVR